MLYTLSDMSHSSRSSQCHAELHHAMQSNLSVTLLRAQRIVASLYNCACSDKNVRMRDMPQANIV